MSAAAPAVRHELDDRLADANMFAWFAPAFALAFKHWPVSVVASLVAVALNQTLFFLFTFLPFPYYNQPWWVQAGRSLLHAFAYVVLVAVAYRFVAQRENVGEVNGMRFAIVRALQIAVVWLVAGALAAAAIGGAIFGVASSLVQDFDDLLIFFVLIGICGLGAFLLMPTWFSLAVAGALSTVHAVRSAKGAFGAIGAALRLAFAQKRRVFWPSYVVGTVVAAFYGLVIFAPGTLLSFGLLFALAKTFLTTSFAIMLPFVIERAYAPHLTLPDAGEVAAELPLRVAPASVSTPPESAPLPEDEPPAESPPPPPPPRARAPAPAGPPLPAAPDELAALLAADIQAHRVQRIVEIAEAGLAADARFFVAQPDDTLVASKRLAAAQRPDLALRLVQPYLKEQRGHRHHLTVALYAANLLRDLDRSSDAARFLVQVKALYPNEPMVDQLIKITDKALATAGAPT